jgi:murein DD-endopeptidase MepM/ murein hydrolase activator NlpD
MRRFGVSLAILAVVCASASQAGAQTFTIVTTPQQPPVSVSAPAPVALPSYRVPNRPGSVTMPFALSRPPAQPAVLSYDELKNLWQRAGAAYGVPWQVLGAINKIESNLGRNMGPSSAGAVGWMQFMPSTWDRWGTDGDSDGMADPWDPEDAVYAAARYLAAAGAHEDISRAVFAYNHAQWYVDEVLSLASQLDSGALDLSAGLGTGVDYQLAALQDQLSAARKQVSRAQRLIPADERKLDRLAQRKLVLSRRAGDATISSSAFERLEARIARIEAEEARTNARLGDRRAALDAAVAAAGDLEDQLAAAALADPVTATAGSPEAVAGYVFPVGGGPEVVSVGHHHHDYPAADIAAPEGSPLFALADSFVLDTYDVGNCGIGFKIELQDGTQYTYCHLSYREPAVHTGGALAAGQPVGLVGHTGHATGPHLHLQLDPTTSYPQDEAWFQSFAGVAFSWQDAPTPKREKKRSVRVFKVMDDHGDPFSGGVITFTR